MAVAAQLPLEGTREVFLSFQTHLGPWQSQQMCEKVCLGTQTRNVNPRNGIGKLS